MVAGAARCVLVAHATSRQSQRRPHRRSSSRPRRRAGVEAVGPGRRSRRRSGRPGRRGRGRPAGRRGGRRRRSSGAEPEDDPAEPRGGRRAAAASAEDRGEQGDRDQEEGVGVDRRLRGRPSERAAIGQSGVTGLADLDPAVVDELGGEQADGEEPTIATADRRARGVSTALARVEARTAQAAVAARRALGTARAVAGRRTPIGRSRRPIQRTQPSERGSRRAWPAQQPLRPAASRRGVARWAPRDQRRLGPEDQPVDLSIDAARPLEHPSRERFPTALARCYYPRRLVRFFFSGLSRARKGLFLAPIPVLAGRLLFRSSPLQFDTLTLRPCHEASH